MVLVGLLITGFGESFSGSFGGLVTKGSLSSVNLRRQISNLLASVMLRALFLSAILKCALLETAVEEASFPNILPLEMLTHREIPAEQTGWERK